MQYKISEVIDTFQEGVLALLQLCLSDIRQKKIVPYDYVRKEFSILIREIDQTSSAVLLLNQIIRHDVQTFIHSVNVTFYAVALAKKQGLSEAALTEIGMGALLHDAGKTLIPLQVLNKKGKLKESEFAIIQKHAAWGASLTAGHFSQNVVDCAVQHHERVDGKGYPQGLTGREIHPYAQIISVADVFDALTSHRPYRKAMPPETAISIIEAGAGTQFNNKLVKQFMELLAM